MLKLTLFGAGQASYCDRPLAGFPNQQCHLLLCYLLLNRHHPHYRERLAAVFWGDSPTAVARKSLRNALWRLRCALHAAGADDAEYLSIGEDSISFLTSSRYWLDVDAFETAATRHDDLSGHELTPAQAADLEQAIPLYQGELLEGVYEDWCLHDRERLRLLYLNALSKLMAFHESNGSYERGLAFGEAILAEDNTREKVHRQMMRLYWLTGDRNAALAQYKRCAQILREELGVFPMEETRRLYQLMMRNQYSPASGSGPRDASPAAAARPDESLPSLAEHALHRIRRLQATIEDTSTELHHIEDLISLALLNSR